MGSLSVDERKQVCAWSGGIRWESVAMPVEVSVDRFRARLRNWYREWNSGRTVCQ